MILCDTDLIRRINRDFIIDPFDKDSVQPASVDLRLDDIILVPKNTSDIINVKKPQDKFFTSHFMNKDFGYILEPRAFILAQTFEKVNIPHDLVARIEGRSSLGRMGIIIHSTAGFIDPGFRGKITLEMSNLMVLPIRIFPFMKIGQMTLQLMTGVSERPYGSKLDNKYQHHDAPTPSRIYRELELEYIENSKKV
jgi:dCTP deaminase